MRNIWLLASLFSASMAHAQMSGGSGSGSGYSSNFSSSSSSNVEAKASGHNFSVLMSMARGGVSLGAAYEYMFDGATGVGGHIRTFPKETGNSSGNNGPGFMVFGAQMGHHFYKKRWDLAFTPSFNIISIDSHQTRPDDTTTMGPGMSISLLWQLTDRIALGFDYANYWIWLEDDWASTNHAISDMAVKLKAGF